MGIVQALTIPARRRQDRRALWASAAAPVIAAAFILNIGRHTPILSSLVAGVGLAALAATDATSNRLPATQVRVLAGLTATSLIGESWWHDEWSPLLRALVGAAVVALVFGALWLAMPGAIAFGDVKVTVIAFAAAAAVSWHAGAVMIVLACVIGGFVAVVARRTRRHLVSAADHSVRAGPRSRLRRGGDGSVVRDRLIAIVLTAGVLASACSGDGAAGPTTDSQAPNTTATSSSPPSSTVAPSSTPPPTTNAPSTSAAPSTSPPSTVVTSESLQPTIEQLVDSYDAVVAEILANPSVASNVDDALVGRYLALFPEDSTFATGALGFWASEAAAGRFYRAGPRGAMYDSTVQSVELRSETEAVAMVCTVTSIQIVDSTGAALESQGGVNGGEVVVVRVGDEWLLRDLTEAPPDDCPRPGDS